MCIGGEDNWLFTFPIEDPSKFYGFVANNAQYREPFFLLGQFGSRDTFSCSN